MFDCAIIGTGPAGLSAAINLKLHEKSFIWFGSRAFSDKVQKSEKIANYPGVGLLAGPAMNAGFRAHVEEMGLTIEDKMVTNIMPMSGSFALLAENEMYQAKTVLLATGVVSAKGFIGEEQFLGRGVSYCATCDGFLNKGATIAVFCGAKRYEHEVEYLAGLAEKVYLSAPYRDCGIALPNVEKIGPIQEVVGDKKVSAVRLHDGTELPIKTLFCIRSAVAPATLLPGLEVSGAHIVVNRAQETNVPGCFAAGDCTGRPYQIAKAVGEGNVAAHGIIEYLSKEAKK